jgi:hypothetical protein
LPLQCQLHATFQVRLLDTNRSPQKNATRFE